jgi:tripartite-type tricarboxylate transporter receptor subunit TctC
MRLEAWFGLLAPVGTPPSRVARLNVALNETLSDQVLSDMMLASGHTPLASAPAELAARSGAWPSRSTNAPRRAAARGG